MIPFLSLKDVTALHGAEINAAVTRVVNSGWYLQGEENKRFEANYANFIGTKHCIGCANGLDALIWIFRVAANWVFQFSIVSFAIGAGCHQQSRLRLHQRH